MINIHSRLTLAKFSGKDVSQIESLLAGSGRLIWVDEHGELVLEEVPLDNNWTFGISKRRELWILQGHPK